MAKNQNTRNLNNLLYSRPVSDLASDAKLFVNREKELNTTIQAIQNEYNTIIIGSKGSGKTSLLYRVKALAQGLQIIPILSDMSLFALDIDHFLDVLLYSLMESVSKQDMSKALRKTIADLPAEIGISILGSGLSFKKEQDVGSVETKYRIMQKLVEIVKDISKKKTRIFFLIDNLSQRPDFFVEVFGRYRDFLWQLQCNFIATCDKEAMPLVWVPPVSSFFDVKIPLTPMSEMTLERLLSIRGFKNKRAIQNIHVLSNGSPRIALDIARSLITGQTSEEDIERTVLKQRKLVNDLTPSEKAVLEEIQTRGYASASDKEFQEATGYKRARLTQILRKLKQKRLLIAEQKGKIAFYHTVGEAYQSWNGGQL